MKKVNKEMTDYMGDMKALIISDNNLSAFYFNIDGGGILLLTLQFDVAKKINKKKWEGIGVIKVKEKAYITKYGYENTHLCELLPGSYFICRKRDRSGEILIQRFKEEK
jgi:hypothetical protein